MQGQPENQNTPTPITNSKQLFDEQLFLVALRRSALRDVEKIDRRLAELRAAA